MIETLATLLVSLLGLYLLIGFLFSLPFLTRIAGRIDPAAAKGTLGFRLLILPGTVALWPMLLRRMRQVSGEKS